MDLESLAAAANDPKRRDTTAALLAFLLESGWPGGSMEDSPTGLGVGSFKGGALIPLSVASGGSAPPEQSPTPQPSPTPNYSPGDEAALTLMEAGPKGLKQDLQQFFSLRKDMVAAGYPPPKLTNYLSTMLGTDVADKMKRIRQRAGRSFEDEE